MHKGFNVFELPHLQLLAKLMKFEKWSRLPGEGFLAFTITSQLALHHSQLLVCPFHLFSNIWLAVVLTKKPMGIRRCNKLTYNVLIKSNL